LRKSLILIRTKLAVKRMVIPRVVLPEIEPVERIGQIQGEFKQTTLKSRRVNNGFDKSLKKACTRSLPPDGGFYYQNPYY
jgi:hypothetical protein